MPNEPRDALVDAFIAGAYYIADHAVLVETGAGRVIELPQTGDLTIAASMHAAEVNQIGELTQGQAVEFCQPTHNIGPIRWYPATYVRRSTTGYSDARHLIEGPDGSTYWVPLRRLRVKAGAP